MSTEGNQSSGNRDIPLSQEDSREEERQRTGLFRWDDPENLMPSWPVPRGLIVPGPRQPDADARPSEPGPRPSESGSRPAAAETPADRSSSWPGVAPPAGWFLHSAQSPPAARQERIPAQEPGGDQPGQRFAPRLPAPAPDTGASPSETTIGPPADPGQPAEPESPAASESP